MPRLFLAAILTCFGVQTIVAAPLRILYEGRVADAENRWNPVGTPPTYLNVRGEFVIDPILPEGPRVTFASMIVEDKAISVVAPHNYRDIFIENDISRARTASDLPYTDGTHDAIVLGARFVGRFGEAVQPLPGFGFDVTAPGSPPSLAMDFGYGIVLRLWGPASWFDPAANSFSVSEVLPRYENVLADVDYREIRLSDEWTYSPMEITRFTIVPEPCVAAMVSWAIAFFRVGSPTRRRHRG